MTSIRSIASICLLISSSFVRRGWLLRRGRQASVPNRKCVVIVVGSLRTSALDVYVCMTKLSELCFEFLRSVGLNFIEDVVRGVV